MAEVFPDFKNSIVNLTATLMKKKGMKTHYSSLKLPLKKNVCLIIIDGLGYEYAVEHKLFSRMLGNKKNSLKKITSVFPSATAVALTSYLTGVAPSEHCSTGLSMYVKELGCIGLFPFYVSRGTRMPFEMSGLDVYDILKAPGHHLFDRVVLPRDIKESLFSETMFDRMLVYRNRKGMFNQMQKALQKHSFVLGYSPVFDSLSHQFGVGSQESLNEATKMVEEIEHFAKKLRNTTVIVSSDHGFIDTEKKRIISIEDHPEFADCLSQVLCGEYRAAYCYVKPSKAKVFEDYVKKKWKHACTLYRSEKLLKKGIFGPHIDPSLSNRIGDYVLIPKKNYVFVDKLPHERKGVPIGHHGGTSSQEMYCPLLVLN